MCPSSPRKLTRFAYPLICLLATLLACVIILYVSIPMSNTAQAKFDVILVLGNPASRDGSIAPIAKSRVLEAIRQYRAGMAPALLMTGGAAANQFVEAQVMRQFALSQGVPATDVYAEGQSLNTIQNAFYSSRMMQQHGWNSVLIVSSPSHVRRAALIFSHYAFPWRITPAPWPPGYPLGMRMWLWCSEAGYTGYVRIFGFPNGKHFLPKNRFALPRL